MRKTTLVLVLTVLGGCAGKRAENVPPIDDKVLKVLKFVDEKGEAPEGYEGGRTFLNVEKHLPVSDDKGRH